MWCHIKLLQLTTLAYVYPSCVAIQSRTPHLQWLMPLLVVTSWVNHSTPMLPGGGCATSMLHLLRLFDVALAHFIVGYHNALCDTSRNQPLALPSCAVHLASVYAMIVFHLQYSRSDAWHASLHIITALASSLLLRALSRQHREGDHLSIT